MLDKPQQLYNTDGGVCVYVAEFDDTVTVRAVEPSIRNEQIAVATNPILKRQRYCVWRLLDFALRQTTGKGVDELTFTRDANGKWASDGAYFSLSHSRYAVAVAVCRTERVGVDVEYVACDRFNQRLADRILTANERATFDSLLQDERSQALVEIWTKKEAVFKRDGGSNFLPKAINTCEDGSFAKKVTMKSGTYWVGASSVSNLPTELYVMDAFEW